MLAVGCRRPSARGSGRLRAPRDTAARGPAGRAPLLLRRNPQCRHRPL